jgi:hypothetical protein
MVVQLEMHTRLQGFKASRLVQRCTSYWGGGSKTGRRWFLFFWIRLIRAQRRSRSRHEWAVSEEILERQAPRN